MLRSVVLALCLLLTSKSSHAQNWPQRPVHFIVPYPAGGGTDIVARVLARKLGVTLDQNFVVENKTGASGMIGAEFVAKSNADGYTFLVASPAEIALNQNLFPKITYDPLRDFVPITLLAWTPMVLAAHPSLGASTMPELVALAHNRSVDFSSPSVGSPHQLVGEYVNTLAGTHLVPVPYRGAAPAVQDVVAGQVKLTISGMPPVVPFLQTGSLKAIAVTSRQRLPIFPDIPTMSETMGFEDFDFTNWFGLLARAGTPEPILDKIAKAAVASLRDTSVRDTIRLQAAEVVGNTRAEFGEFIRAESAKYGKIVALTGMKVD